MATSRRVPKERGVEVRLAEIDTAERGQPWANRVKQAPSGKMFRQVMERQVVDGDRRFVSETMWAASSRFSW